MSKEAALVIAGILLVGYIFVAQAVFAFRHPWATDTERFLYLPRSLVFGHVDYEEARPRH